MATDTEVILLSLQKERNELHEKIMQVDRIIKRVKSLEYTHDSPEPAPKSLNDGNSQPPAQILPQRTDIKVLVLRAFDVLGVAVKLRDIQDEYKKISGNKYNVRETVRSLHKSGLLRSLRDKTAGRSYLWFKAEWLVNGQLADQRKPEGFDMLYKADNLIYE